MEKQNHWKTIAIIFIFLFIIETIFLIWSVISYYSEIDKSNECIYDICSENYDALYQSDVCTCYDLDMFGSYTVAKTQWMK